MTKIILGFVFDIWEVTQSFKEEQHVEVALLLLHLLHCQNLSLLRTTVQFANESNVLFDLK